MEDHVETLVPGYDEKCVADLGRGGLLGDGLDFVPVGEGREENVEVV